MSRSDARHLEKARRNMNRAAESLQKAQHVIAAAKEQHGEDFRVGTVNMMSVQGGIDVQGNGLFASSSTFVHGRPSPVASSQAATAEGSNARSPMVINTLETGAMSTTGSGTITANYESFTGGATRGTGGGDSINVVAAGTMQAVDQGTIAGMVRHSDRPANTSEPDNVRQLGYFHCAQRPQTAGTGKVAGIVDYCRGANGQTTREFSV